MPPKYNVDYEEFATEAPGPGAYQPELGRSARSFTLTGRRTHDHSSEDPGPGSYDIPSTFGATTGSSLKGRVSSFDRPRDDVPGPGSYATFGTTGEDGQLQGVRHGYTMSSRHHEARQHATPGPGMYQSETYGSIANVRPISTTLKGRRTFQYDISDAPAPGAYAPEEHRSRTQTYSLQGRKRDNGGRSDEPGPGQYESKPAGRPNSPSFSLSGRPRRSRLVIEHMARAEF